MFASYRIRKGAMMRSRRVACPECNQAFAGQSLLDYHMEGVHPELPEQRAKQGLREMSLSQKSELVMGMSLGVPSKRHQLGRW